MTKPKYTHEQLEEIALKRPGVKKAYDALKEEFDLFEAMIKARLEAGKTQEDVAKEMKTSTSVVGRLETGGGAHKHSPTYESLRRYAKAVNCNLKVVFEPQSKGAFAHIRKVKAMRKSLTSKSGHVRESGCEDIHSMRSSSEVLPKKLLGMLPKRKRGERGAQKAPKK